MAQKIGILHDGGLKDLALSLPDLSRFHQSQQDTHITFITKRPYVDVANQSGYFNAVWDAPMPLGRNILSWFIFRLRLKGFGFDKIYSTGKQKPPLVATDPLPDQNGKVLKGWCQRDISFYQLPNRFALIHVPEKDEDTWSATRMGTLCKKISQDKITPILIGKSADTRAIERIEKICPTALDFTGQIDWLDMVALGHHALFCIGHDRPDLYLIAFADCPVLCLISDKDELPDQPPKGKKVVCLQDSLHSLPVKTVYDLLQEHEFYG